MKANIQQTDWVYLSREAFLLVVCAYVIMFGGGFSALVDFRLQAASTILAIAVLGGWLGVRILKKGKIAVSGIDLAILLFLASQFIAVAFSEDPRRSLPHAIVWLAYVLVFYFTLDILKRGWPQELIAKCLLIIAGLILAFSLLNLGQLYLEWRSFATTLEFFPSFQQRLSTILGDPNLLAAFTNLILPLGLAFFLLASNRVAQVVMAMYVVASIVVLYFTDSRGGLLGFGAIVGSFTILWMLIVSESAKSRFLYLWAWMSQRRFLLFGLIAVFLVAAGFVAWRFLSFEGSTTHGRVADARDIYWSAAIEALKVDPVTGAGPGIYPIYLMKLWSTPPARPYLHAHGFPFQIAAESGLLGLASFAILFVAILRKVWTVWKVINPSQRAWWVAAVAGLVGLLTHSLVDDFFPFPAVGFVAFIYLAVIVSPGAGTKGGSKKELNPWLIAAPGIAAAAFTIFCLNAYWHADQAVTLGSQGDWQGAAAEILAASNADPTLGFYWLQTGYAYGRLAITDISYFDEALTAYERGIDLEPNYALNRANLSTLLWSADRQDESLQQMRIATGLASEAYQLHLTQGAYEEELGFLSEASSSYLIALNLRPDIAGSAFWKGSELRTDVVEVEADIDAMDSLGLTAASLIAAARDRISKSDFDSARSFLHEAYAINDQNIRLYVGLGELALGNGELDKAERYFQAALWILATDNQAKVEAILFGAQISLASGDSKEALRRYEIAYNAIFAETSYGWGSTGWSPYAWFVFQRRTFPEDLLPQLERADITTNIATKLLPLIDLYEEMGELEKAQSVSDVLSQYLP